MGQETDQRSGRPCGARIYANDLRVEFSLSECCLDFAQSFGPEDVRLQSRLVTSPTTLARIHAVIGNALAAYEAEYGQIPRRGAAEEDG